MERGDMFYFKDSMHERVLVLGYKPGYKDLLHRINYNLPVF